MKAKTKKEREHLAWVASQPCIICGKPPPSECHHVRTVSNRKRDHTRVLPLCPDHHRGQMSIHNCKGQFTEKHGTQEYLLARLNATT